MRPHPPVAVIVICRRAALLLPETVETVIARIYPDARLRQEAGA